MYLPIITQKSKSIETELQEAVTYVGHITLEQNHHSNESKSAYVIRAEHPRYMRTLAETLSGSTSSELRLVASRLLAELDDKSASRRPSLRHRMNIDRTIDQ